MCSFRPFWEQWLSSLSKEKLKFQGLVGWHRGNGLSYTCLGLGAYSKMKNKNLFLYTKQMYEGMHYKLSMTFPANYSFTAPKVKFITPCFHPNVDTDGNICLDILKEQWLPSYDVRSILLSIQGLLAGEMIIPGPQICHKKSILEIEGNLWVFFKV